MDYTRKEYPIDLRQQNISWSLLLRSVKLYT